jgi:hypothetical protein
MDIGIDVSRQRNRGIRCLTWETPFLAGVFVDCSRVVVGEITGEQFLNMRKCTISSRAVRLHDSFLHGWIFVQKVAACEEDVHSVWGTLVLCCARQTAAKKIAKTLQRSKN